MKKETIIVLGGGSSFENVTQMLEYYNNYNIENVYSERDWKDWLVWSLGDKFEFLKPQFPGRDNANYSVWKIIFEKYLNTLKEKRISIIAHSLGTIFILKYLTENKLKINNLHLVASIVSNDFQPKSDPEGTGTFTFDISKVSSLQNKTKKIYLWHSLDDKICSIKNSEYLHSNLPNAKFTIFKNKGHFIDSTFMELFLEILGIKK